MTTTSSSLSSEPLTREECQRRLEESGVARVLLSLRGLPAALPARIELVKLDHVVISSRENAVLLAARRGDVISVQIDGLDADNAIWSVTATGIAAWISPSDFESDRFQRLADCGATTVNLPLTVVTGQREH
jgi:pyridoxamine 5'-phosphate oxidase-like protein